jgi:hypothetical protein
VGTRSKNQVASSKSKKYEKGRRRLEHKDKDDRDRNDGALPLHAGEEWRRNMRASCNCDFLGGPHGALLPMRMHILRSPGRGLRAEERKSYCDDWVDSRAYGKSNGKGHLLCPLFMRLFQLAPTPQNQQPAEPERSQ